MECFAFGGATVRFASLETSFHAANHTIPPPPSYEGYPLCPKDKNLSLFHGEKPLMIKWFTGRRLCQISQTILHGRDAILRVRVKWLTFNMIPQLWADVKYHVPTGFGFSPKASGFYPFGDATALTGEGDVGDVVWLIQASAWNQTCHSTNDRCEALASLKGCFLCFCFCAPRIYPLNLCMGEFGGKRKNSHRFFGIFIRLNLCEINGLLFEPCLAFSNF